MIIDVSSEVAFNTLAAVDAAVTQEGVHEGAVQVVATAERRPGLGPSRSGTAAERDLRRWRSTDRDDSAARQPAGRSRYTAPSNLVLFVFINTFAVSTILANDRKTG